MDESSPTKCPLTKQLVLDFNEETKEPIIEVDKGLVVKLKPHQVEGQSFLSCNISFAYIQLCGIIIVPGG